MKRNGHMLRANAPRGGRIRKSSFKGFRNKHWREMRVLVGSHPNGLPIHEWHPEPVFVVKPIRAARLHDRLVELQRAAANGPESFLKRIHAGEFSKFDLRRAIPKIILPRRGAA